MATLLCFLAICVASAYTASITPQDVRVFDDCANLRSGVYADGRDCKRYVHCWRGQSYFFRCFDNFVFNPCERRCTFRSTCIRPEECAQRVGFLFLPGAEEGAGDAPVDPVADEPPPLKIHDDSLFEVADQLPEIVQEASETVESQPEIKVVESQPEILRGVSETADSQAAVKVSLPEIVDSPPLPVKDKPAQLELGLKQRELKVEEVAEKSLPVEQEALPTTTMMTYLVRVIFGRKGRPRVSVRLPGLTHLGELTGEGELSEEPNFAVIEDDKEEIVENIVTAPVTEPAILETTVEKKVEEPAAVLETITLAALVAEEKEQEEIKPAALPNSQPDADAQTSLPTERATQMATTQATAAETEAAVAEIKDMNDLLIEKETEIEEMLREAGSGEGPSLEDELPTEKPAPKEAKEGLAEEMLAPEGIKEVAATEPPAPEEIQVIDIDAEKEQVVLASTAAAVAEQEDLQANIALKESDQVPEQEIVDASEQSESTEQPEKLTKTPESIQQEITELLQKTTALPEGTSTVSEETDLSAATAKAEEPKPLPRATTEAAIDQPEATPTVAAVEPEKEVKPATTGASIELSADSTDAQSLLEEVAAMSTAAPEKPKEELPDAPEELVVTSEKAPKATDAPVVESSAAPEAPEDAAEEPEEAKETELPKSVEKPATTAAPQVIEAKTTLASEVKKVEKVLPEAAAVVKVSEEAPSNNAIIFSAGIDSHAEEQLQRDETVKVVLPPGVVVLPVEPPAEVIVDKKLPHMCNITAASEQAVCQCPNQEQEAKLAPYDLLAHCQRLVCLNGGMYLTLSSGHCGCVCPVGWQGESCQHLVEQSLCHCANGGHCVSVGNSTYACSCPIGYFGGQCQYHVDQIEQRAENLISYPFKHHFSPIVPANGDHALCRVNVCANGGMCLRSMQTGTRSCYCTDNYAGRFCESYCADC